MENRLDKLFKDRLSKHEEIPTPKAWNQLHERLAANRRKAWGKRLAIAASILLFATVGYIGYQSLDTLTIKKDQLVAITMDDKVTNEEQPIAKPKEEISEIKNSKENVIDPVNKLNKQQEDIIQEKSIEKIIQEPKVVELPVKKAEEKTLISVAVLDNSGVEQEAKVQGPKELIEEPILSDSSSEVLLAENEPTEEIQDLLKQKEQKKTYAQVKIIYKADRNSELVASGKKTFINKGIDKLTKFSDEHLLTADRKTKLRNTKDGLLAMNISKLLNKSNKEGI